MQKRSPNDAVDLRTGKPIETPKKRAAKTAPSAGADRHKWEFKPRFRRGAFGWKSQPAFSRIKEAVSEIKKVARKDSALAAEGAVTFFERRSPVYQSTSSIPQARTFQAFRESIEGRFQGKHQRPNLSVGHC